MVNADLMDMILRIVYRNNVVRLVIVGDVNQLSPIGRGNPLADLIASGK